MKIGQKDSKLGEKVHIEPSGLTLERGIIVAPECVL
jgi:hypothetical protein